MNVFNVEHGDSPIILGQPHGGTFVPEAIASRFNTIGHALADTDWHITKLYSGLLPGVTVVRSNIHRYVIDANRDPGGASLYPGQNTTTLCPTTDFDGKSIYLSGQEPSDDEVDARRLAYHKPYHDALMAEIDRVKQHHGIAVLYDCHSIRSNIPHLFEGQLPVFSIGTNDTETCDVAFEHFATEVCVDAGDYDWVVNGRFKGGWTTRHYGRPLEGVHAIQMELAQRSYMNETPGWNYRPDLADRLRVYLKQILDALHEVAISEA